MTGAPFAHGRVPMNPGTGPDIELCDEYDPECMECDGTGELDCGRDWQRMTCETCHGTGYAPRLSREDHDAHVADAQNDQEWLEERV